MTSDEFEKALQDPASCFQAPEDVLAAKGLTVHQQAEILRRWQYNASEEAVALEEGMPGDETGLMRRILLALGEVAGPIDVEHTPPTKQHGVTRSAIKYTK